MTRSVVRDPVSRVRMSVDPEGENLTVDKWIEPGGALPAPITSVVDDMTWAPVRGDAGTRRFPSLKPRRGGARSRSA